MYTMWGRPNQHDRYASHGSPRTPVRGSIPNSFPTTSNEIVEKSQASVDNQLLGLPGPYHWHAIGTFNTYSQGPTHWSLTDSGGGYNLKGAVFSHTTLRPSQSAVFTFHQRVPLGLQFNQVLSIKPKFEFKNLWPPRGLSTTRPSTVANIYD
jgi:hypothetical protein